MNEMNKEFRAIRIAQMKMLRTFVTGLAGLGVSSVLNPDEEFPFDEDLERQSDQLFTSDADFDEALCSYTVVALIHLLDRLRVLGFGEGSLLDEVDNILIAVIDENIATDERG